MAARKTRKLRTVESGDVFEGMFQPPQARSGMMKVAGATDADNAGEQLITDDDPTTLNGPVVDDGRDQRALMSVRELKELVRRLVLGA